METKELKVRIKFLREVLGTCTGDKDIYRSFIQSKAESPNDDELENLPTEEIIEKGKTYFPRKDNKPFIYDYQIRGFFKSACSALKKIDGTLSSKEKAFKKKIDLNIFVKDRENFIENITEITECQRPLRCSTMQGERVSLAISEQINAGATCDFTILLLNPKDKDLVIEWLDYGRFNGFLQWRNSGKGSFEFEILD